MSALILISTVTYKVQVSEISTFIKLYNNFAEFVFDFLEIKFLSFLLGLYLLFSKLCKHLL